MDSTRSIHIQQYSSLPTLFSTSSPSKKRTQSLDEQRKKEEWKKILLGQIRGSSSVDITDKELALILGDSFLQNTGLEGGTAEIGDTLYQKIFAAWDSNVCPVAPPSLTEDEKRQWEQDRQDLFLSGQLVTQQNPGKLIESIKQGLDSRGRFVLRASIAGTKTDPIGYVFAIIFEKKEGKIFAHIVNKGEGSSLHPILQIEGKIKHSYQYYPIEIKEALFEKNGRNYVGMPFFTKFIEYATKEAPDEKPYSSKEIYRQLELWGEFVPSPSMGSIEEERLYEAVMSQRSGTCALQVFRLTLRHLLSQTRGKETVSSRYEIYKRFVLYEKSLALFTASCVLTHSPRSRDLDLVENCLRAFQSCLLKGEERKILTQEELCKCEALGNILEEKIAELRDKKTETLSGLDKPISNSKQYTLSQPSFHAVSDRWDFSDPIPESTQGILSPTPENFASALAQIHALSTSGGATLDRALAIYSFVRHLPPPSAEYWLHIPAKNVDQVFVQILDLQTGLYNALSQAFSVDLTQAGFFHWFFLHQITTYGIALRLADRSPSLKMQGFTPPPLPLDKIHERFHFHTEADTTRRMDVLQDLKKIQEAKKGRRVLGLWASNRNDPDYILVNFEKIVPGFMKQDATIEQQHLQYVAQFSKNPNKEPCDLTERDFYNLLKSPNFTDKSQNIPLCEGYYSFEKAYHQTLTLLFCREIDNEIPVGELWYNLYSERMTHALVGVTYSFKTEKEGTQCTLYSYRRGIPSASVSTFNKKNIEFRAGSIEDSFLDTLLSDHRGKRQTENSIVTNTYQGNISQDKSVYHMIEKALRFSELSASAFSAWCEDHAKVFEVPQNRHYLEIVLLRDQKLSEKVRDEPLFAQRLRSMVIFHLERNVCNRNLEAALFWSRLGIHIETHNWKGLGAKRERTFVDKMLAQLELLRKKMEKCCEDKAEHPLWNRDIFLHKAYICVLTQPEEEKGVAEWVKNFLWSQYCFKPVDAKSPAYLHYELLEHLRDQCYGKRFHQGIIRGITAFCQELKIGEIPEDQYIMDQFPLVRFQKDHENYTVDLREGIFVRGENRLWQESIPLDKLNRWEKGLIYEQAKRMAKKGAGVFETPEQDLRLEIIVDSDIRISKVFTFGGKSDLYTYQRKFSFECFQKKDPWMERTVHPLMERTVFWKSPVQPKGDFWYMIMREDGTPLAKVCCSSTNTIEQIVKVDTKGYVLSPENPLQAIVLQSERPIPQWRLLQDIAPLEKTLFWEQGEQLAGVEYPPAAHSLVFRVQREAGKPTKLACENLGGEYYVAEQQDRLFVDNLPGSLLLANNRPGMPRILVLPGKMLVQAAEHIRGGDFLLASKKGAESYYFYEIDEVHQQLHHSSTEAMLYLIYVLLFQKKYSLAERYIQEFQTNRFFTKREETIFSYIFSDKEKEQDFHPRAIALHSLLIVHICSAERMALAQQKLSTIPKELNPRFVQVLKRYVDLAGQGEGSQIPHSLRLDKRAREKVLLWLQDRLHREEESLPAILSIELSALQQNIDFSLPHTMHRHIQDEIDAWLYTKQEKINELCFPENTHPMHPSLEIGLLGGINIFVSSYFWIFIDRIIADKEKKDPDIDQQLVSLFLEMKSEKKESEQYATILRLLLLARKERKNFMQNVKAPFETYMAQKNRLNGLRNGHRSITTEVEQREFRTQIGHAEREQRRLQEEWQRKTRKWLEEQTAKIPVLKYAAPNPKAFLVKPSLADTISFRVRSRYVLDSTDVNDSCPLEDLRKKFFSDPIEKEILTEERKEFAVQEAIGELRKNSLAEQIGQEILAAHNEKNREKKYAFYPRISGQDLHQIPQDLDQRIADAQVAMEDLRSKIERDANGEVLVENIARRGGQKERITVEDLIFDPNHIALAAYNEVERKALHRAVLHFMKLGSLIDQAKRAKVAAEENDEQLVAEILGAERKYKPEEHPELLMYEYFSGNLLRNQPDQAEILQKIFAIIFSQPSSSEKQEALSKLFFEFQAGGGKTKVLSTIIALRTIHEKKQPVFFSLPDLHDVAKADLRDSLSRFFKVKLNIVEISILDQPTNEQLQAIYEQIIHSYREGCCDVITPETWHALHLNYAEAHITGNRERLSIITDILNHYQNKGVFLIDEAHVNLDALLRANIAFGQIQPLPPAQQRLYLDMWKTIMGLGTQPLLKEGRPLHQLLGPAVSPDIFGIQQNQQAIESKKYLPEVQKAFVDYLLAHPMAQGFAEAKKAELRNFFLREKDPAPQWLWDLYHQGGKERESAELLTLAKGILYDVMPQAMGMVHLMDYGPSVKEEDLTDSPWENKKPQNSKFESIDLTTAITIQGKYQRGLVKHEMMKFITSICDVYKANQESGAFALVEHIPIYQKFLRWQDPLPDKEKVSLEMLTESWLSEKENVNWLVKNLGKKPAVIDDFLLEHVLPSIHGFGQKLTSTAADLASGCFAFISFSATLGRNEKYPYLDNVKKQFLPEAPFMADVIHRSCLPQNGEVEIFPSGTCQELFAQIHACKQERAEGFEELEGWLNVGGWAKEVSSAEAAAAFLDFAREKRLDYQGVVYFKTFRERGSTKEEKVLYLRKKKESREDDEEIRLEGSNLAKELPKHGVALERIFKIYGPSETTGTDLLISDNAKLIVTLGESVTASRLVQAIMRMRRFLSPHIEETRSQKIFWVVPQALKEQILRDIGCNPKQPLMREQIWRWTIEKEAEVQHDAILLCAQQEIDFAFRKEIRSFLDRATKKQDWALREQLFAKHRKAIDREMSRDPFLRWGGAKQNVPTRELLQGYADDLAASYAMPLHAFDGIKNRIESVIQQTEKRIQEVATGLGDRRGQVRQRERRKEQQRVQQKEQEKTKETYGPPSVFPEVSYAENELSLAAEGLEKPLSHQECRTANAIYKTQLLPNHLYILGNAYHTIRVEEEPVRYKPYHYLLVVDEPTKEGGDYQRNVFVVSQKDAQAYQAQLLKGKGKGRRRAALVSPNGKIVQNGKQGLQIPLPEVEQWMEGKGETMEEIFNAAQLLNGQVRDRKYIDRLYRNTMEPFKALWQRLHAGALDAELVDVARVRNVVRAVNEELGITDEDWLQRHILPDPRPATTQQNGQGNAYVRAGQFIKELWCTSKVFRAFCFLTFGLLPLLLYMIGLIKFRRRKSTLR